MIAKLIGKIVIVLLLVAGAYVGFRMVFRDETFLEALGQTHDKVAEKVKEQLAKRDTPIKQADSCYEEGNYQEAVEHYQNALERADAPDADASENLTAEQRCHVTRRLADSYYEMAGEAGWSADKVKPALEAYTEFLADFPDIAEEDRALVSKRIGELQLKAFLP